MPEPEPEPEPEFPLVGSGGVVTGGESAFVVAGPGAGAGTGATGVVLVSN